MPPSTERKTKADEVRHERNTRSWQAMKASKKTIKTYFNASVKMLGTGQASRVFNCEVVAQFFQVS